jgi:hypothetical protein
LESADNGEFQPLVDIIAANQISSIERALNWQTVTGAAGYNDVLTKFEKKLNGYNNVIDASMYKVFDVIKARLDRFKDWLNSNFENRAAFTAEYIRGNGTQSLIDSGKVESYAKLHDYFLDMASDKYYGVFHISIGHSLTYKVVIFLHYYGYGRSTYAIGSYYSKDIHNGTPLELPPLTMSSEKDAELLTPMINEYIEQIIFTVLANITNELG